MATDTALPGEPDIQPVSIVTEMRTSFLDYAMSVIVARALPDVRDGLKPVHRRILWGAHEGGYVAGKPYRKSARIVGDVMGKYHPHGDSSIYDALVRMAQDWSLRLPLVDGQGNFGSMDPDAPAAMRYTEARLAKVADSLLDDIDKDTVDFAPNYDGQEVEPTVLPARFPNLLVNGAGGIAVGMATNIPPHNLGEIIDACRAYLDDPGIDTDGLMAHVRGPDFPTGALLLGTTGIRQAYATGRGSVIMRSRTIVEEGRGDRRSVVLTEIPYQQGKNALHERIAEAVRDKRIEGVSEIRDESSREGVRLVLDLKRDATPEVVLNQLYRHTPAQQSFAINMLAIRGGRPELLNLRDVIAAFIAFREEVITRRSKFELNKARERAHILLGLMIAVANLDEVVRLIRAAPTPAEARTALLARDWPMGDIRPYLGLVEAIAPEDFDAGDTYKLSDVQVRAILDLRLSKLTALGRDEIADELKGLAASIEDLLDILRSRARLQAVMRSEFDALQPFVTKRRTELIGAGDDIDDEDLIEREDMVVTVTLGGYIKRVSLATYRAQGRGGKGRAGMTTKDEDAVGKLFVASTHTPVLFFSSTGKVYRAKVWRIPEGGPNAKGRPMIHLLPRLEGGETIVTVLPLPEDEDSWARLHVMFATAHGYVRRNAMDAFTRVPSQGKLAIRFEDGDDDRLIAVALCDDRDDVFLATRSGKAIRFAADDVREFVSRTSTGVRGMTLADGDEVISMAILGGFDATPQEREDYLKAAAWKDGKRVQALSDRRMAQFAAAEQFILTVTANGFGKRSSAYEYRQTGRGGQGVRNIAESDRNGPVVASFPATDADEVMLAANSGKVIRLTVGDLRVIGRGSQGVTLFGVADGEHVVSAAKIGRDSDAGELLADEPEPAV